jgi:hypothetical protein
MPMLTLRRLAVLAVALAALCCFPGIARARNADRALLQAYQPVTCLGPAEQFRPASVNRSLRTRISSVWPTG